MEFLKGFIIGGLIGIPLWIVVFWLGRIADFTSSLDDRLSALESKRSKK